MNRSRPFVGIDNPGAGTQLPGLPFVPSTRPTPLIIPPNWIRHAAALRAQDAAVQAQNARAQALAAAQAAGYTTPAKCTTNPALHCSFYALIPQQGGLFDIHIVARPSGGTDLLVNTAAPTMVPVLGVGAVRMFPAAWIDAPGGAIWGYMLDGSFST